MNPRRKQHIAIVGGGFSGTMTAVNVARLCEVPLRVTVINHGYPTGRGIAYSTRRPEHLLNVAARNMSALPEYPNHFVEWLRTRSEYAEVPEAELRETFMPRRVYGDYLRDLLFSTTHPFDHRCPVEIGTVEDEVLDIDLEDEASDGGVRLKLATGGALRADKVVLATGNEAPAALPGAAALVSHPAYGANPWVSWEDRLPPPNEKIVLLGTGLTAVDAIITLLALEWPGTIHAVSRHGWLPQSHFKGVDYPDFPPAEVDLAQLGLKALVQLIEEHCARLRRRNANPAIVVDKMRPHTQRVWQAWSPEERREFATRHAARWNVIRHRIAQPLHGQVTAALEAGRLKIWSGGVARLEANEARIRVHLSDEAGVPRAPLEGALVINCTGPDTRFSATPSPLLRNLLTRGVAQPDAMDMGIRVAPNFAVIDRAGASSRSVFAMGPLLRGTLWESVAVPELRGQALRMAQTLVADIAPSRRPAWADQPEPAVLEYWI